MAVLPQGTQNDYGFSWQFGEWESKINGVTVPVLGYIVKDVRQKTTAPTDFHVKDCTTKDLTIVWSKSRGQIDHYILYRMQGVAPMPYGNDTCTEPAAVNIYICR